MPACLVRAQVAEARGDYERVVEALAPVVRLPWRPTLDKLGFWPWYDVYANALAMTNRIEEADAFLALRPGRHEPRLRPDAAPSGKAPGGRHRPEERPGHLPAPWRPHVR